MKILSKLLRNPLPTECAVPRSDEGLAAKRSRAVTRVPYSSSNRSDTCSGVTGAIAHLPLTPLNDQLNLHATTNMLDLPHLPHPLLTNVTHVLIGQSAMLVTWAIMIVPSAVSTPTPVMITGHLLLSGVN